MIRNQELLFWGGQPEVSAHLLQQNHKTCAYIYVCGCMCMIVDALAFWCMLQTIYPCSTSEILASSSVSLCCTTWSRTLSNFVFWKVLRGTFLWNHPTKYIWISIPDPARNQDLISCPTKNTNITHDCLLRLILHSREKKPCLAIPQTLSILECYVDCITVNLLHFQTRRSWKKI